jgi:leucyl aminopeptidase
MTTLTKKKYNFKTNQNPTSTVYDTVLILCTIADFTEIKKQLSTKLRITIPDELETIYSGNKGNCVYFYVGKTTYMLMQFSLAPVDMLKMSGIIGKKICSNDGCESVLVILCSADISYVSCLLQGVYKYEDFKTDKSDESDKSDKSSIPTIDFYCLSEGQYDNIDKLIEHNLIQYEIRDLINAPVNILNSRTYSDYIKQNLNSNSKIRLEIKEEE